MRIKFFNIKTDNIKSEEGFTLVELILVTIVTGILSSSLVLPFLSSMKNATQPEIYNTASYLAVNEMEKKRSTGYTAVSGNIGTSTDSIDLVYSQSNSAKRTYNYQVVTEYVTHSAGSYSHSDTPTEFIKVTVTVSNANIPDIVLWEILAKDFYDPDAN